MGLRREGRVRAFKASPSRASRRACSPSSAQTASFLLQFHQKAHFRPANPWIAINHGSSRASIRPPAIRWVVATRVRGLHGEIQCIARPTDGRSLALREGSCTAYSKHSNGASIRDGSARGQLCAGQRLLSLHFWNGRDRCANYRRVVGGDAPTRPTKLRFRF